MANERPYVEEWIHFHAAQGVGLFRIYVDRTRTDLSDDGTAALLRAMAHDFNIEVVDWTEPGVQRQIAAFNAGIVALRGRAQWAAFIDADEFLFDPHPLPEWLGGAMRDLTAPNPPALVQWLQMTAGGASAIAVQQRVFGSSGRLDMPTEPVTAAYTLRASAAYPEHRWYKSIIRPDHVERFTNSHHAVLRDGYYVLGDGFSFNVDGPGRADRIAEDGLRLHHYILKSKAEWLTKKAKGALSDGAVAGFRRFTDQYAARDANCNAVRDETLARAMEPFAEYKRREVEAMGVWEGAH